MENLDLILPEILGLNPELLYFKSTNVNENDDTQVLEYDVSHIRVKFSGKTGPGKIDLWYDAATYASDDLDNDLTYLWLSYAYNCYSGEFGSIALKPTIRMQTGKVGDPEYVRNKFELTTEIKFK